MGEVRSQLDWEAERVRFWNGVRSEQEELGLGWHEAEAETALRWARFNRRMAWLNRQFSEMCRLHDVIAEYWGAFFDEHPGLRDADERDESEMPDPPEQAELEKIEAAIEAAVDRDEWPRELYFREV